jgi:ADP-heptose:LPS heptosyltransferase
MEMRARRLRDFVLQNFSLEHVGNAFSQVVERAFSEFKAVRPEGREETVHALRMKYASANKTLLFTMPMSGGDVFLSTALLSHLRRRHPQARFFYATKPQYRNIVEGIEEIDEVIDWEPWMQDVGLLEDVFTDVYTPNLAIQMAWSNWVHRGQGRNLLEEMAVQCNIPKTEVAVPFVSNEEFKLPFDGPYMVIHTGSGKGQHGARRYNQWADVAEHISKVLMAAKDMWVVQVGLEDEPLLPGVVDLRGQTNYRQLYTVIAGARCVLSIDSISMHMAAAAKVPYVSLFGGSYADSTGPWRHMFGQRPGDGVLIETTDRLGCERACYKNECRVDPENPCINNINARDVVWNAVWYATGGDTTEADVAQMSYKRRVPKISGYTHVMDAKKHGYPFVQSIRSMLGFCSEVVVIDGGSTDGTLEDIAAIGDARVKVIHNTWDPEEPGMDGMQKALGRVMCDPTAEFLWQQDVDEVVHEDDYEKIIDVCRRFPADMLVLHLPVVELWGDDHTVRTDRHAWKWRLSRNDYRITHGIAKHAVVVDPKTHRIYAKKGMSDGCEYIDAMTREYIPHGGFWNAELDRIRVNDPGRYAEIMNDVFEKIPGVFHYSWADIPRKIRNFKGFWNTMWSRLYNDPSPVDRFPEVQTEDDVLRCAEALRSRGGEHGSAPTFTLRRQPPAVMDGWLKG